LSSGNQMKLQENIDLMTKKDRYCAIMDLLLKRVSALCSNHDIDIQLASRQ
jgi:hypothetical protein